MSTETGDNTDGADTTDPAESADHPVTEPTKPAAARTARPSPAAAAASRARRIGGTVAAQTARSATPAGKAGGQTDKSAAATSPAAPSTTASTKAGASTDKSSATEPPTGKTSIQKTSTPKTSTANTSAEKSTAKSAAAQPSESSSAVTPVRRPVPKWALWTPPVVFLAIAAVFIVLLVVDRVGDRAPGPPSATQRETVLAATKNCVATTNTYRYTDVDKYERAGLKCATGVYASQYRNAMDTLIKKNAPTQKFIQLAQVNNAGVESVSGSGKQWSVLVYGQLNITNSTTGKQGRVDPFALIATMQQVNGKWLIAKVGLLSTVAG